MSKVTICIPVYNGAWCVKETLESAFAQTHKNLEILISIDKSDDGTENVVSEYLRENEKAAMLMTQPKRLGWVGNCNFLLEKASGDYVCILPHDDLIPPNYIENLLIGFVRYPNAVNCFPSVTCFGSKTNKIEQNSIVGSTEERIFNVVDRQYDAVSFRGLVKRIPQRSLRLLRTDQLNDIKVDTLWILQHAIAGEVRHIPDIGYMKRFHEKNTHMEWNKAERAEKTAMWARHCAALFNIARPYVQNKKLLLENCWKRCAQTKNLCIQGLDLTDLSALRVIFRNSLWEEHLTPSNFDKTPNLHVFVLGAGIQGCCVAMMLRKYNYRVTLIDQGDDIMTRASMNQEGKIHLGLVYSKAVSSQTSDKILTSALHFSHYMEYLLDQKVLWESLKSVPFQYIVAKDSLLDVDSMEKIFFSLQKKSTDYLEENPHLSYLGVRFDQMVARSSDFDTNQFIGKFETAEVAIKQPPLKDLIKKRLHNLGVEVIMHKRITMIKKENAKYTIQCTDNEEFKADMVVNCLWESKRYFDEMLGVSRSDRHANMRYKFGVISKPVPALTTQPSFTMVQGPFGDYVNFDDKMYFSWYPNAMRGMVVNSVVPDEWKKWSEQQVPEKMAAEIIDGHKNKFIEIFGKDFDFIEPRLVGGVIVASGVTDIKDTNSELHDRDEETLLDNGEGYYSITTNKFTNGPHNTMLFERVLQQAYSIHCRELIVSN